MTIAAGSNVSAVDWIAVRQVYEVLQVDGTSDNQSVIRWLRQRDRHAGDFSGCSGLKRLVRRNNSTNAASPFSALNGQLVIHFLGIC